ncbi:unnamed protein product [Trichogramma brassicae]|uniref:Uncharacterized protein n=1 Tax=Trichogramma brassicae TaxID=86971 RepID=A0A6H5IP65_9HYME|nr:unnamed protein product [Trichogramma brassicae]
MNWPRPRIRPSIRSSLSSIVPVANSATDGSLKSFSLQCKGATMIFSEIAFTIVEGEVRVNGIGTRSVRLGTSDFSTDVCPCGLCSPSFMAVALPRVARAFGVRTTARGKHSHKRAVLSPTAQYAGKYRAKQKTPPQLHTHSYGTAHTCTDAARQAAHFALTQALRNFV